MRMNIIRIEYAERKSGKDKFFSAKAIRNGSTIKTKTRSVNEQRPNNIAYKEILEEAKLLSETYGLTFKQESMDDVIKAYRNRNKRTDNSKIKVIGSDKRPGESLKSTMQNDHVDSLLDKFSNQLKFKAFLKQLIKLKGIQRTIEILEEGLALTKEMEEAALTEQRAISKANEEMAKIIMQTRASGVDIDAPNAEIEEAIRRLSSKRVAANSNNMEGDYEYKGEKWDGLGSMPGSYSAYLRENENNKIEDLLRTNRIKQRAVA